MSEVRTPLEIPGERTKRPSSAPLDSVAESSGAPGGAPQKHEEQKPGVSGGGKNFVLYPAPCRSTLQRGVGNLSEATHAPCSECQIPGSRHQF